MSNVDPSHYKYRAFQVGLQYYGSGRFSVAAQFTPVAGNLLRHAVEMFLKGCLAPAIGVRNIRALRHDLEKIWREFRVHFAVSTLDEFEALICELHKFEHIRYPETLLEEGGLFSVGFPSDARNTQISGPKVPEYGLSVEDIDVLVKQIFTLGKVSAKAFFILEQEHASKYFSFRNENPLI